MIFNNIKNHNYIANINSTRGQTRFLTCVARVTCLVTINGMIIYFTSYTLMIFPSTGTRLVPDYRRWWKCEWLVFARNCCVARLLPGEAELLSERTGLSGGGQHV